MPEVHTSGSANSFQSVPKPEHLLSARFLPPSTITVAFSDKTFSLPNELLQMPVDRIQWPTLAASPDGASLTVRAIKGEEVVIAARTLRYLVDKDYAAQVDATLKHAQFDRNELEELFRDNPPRFR